jgi:uncharacterized membrane protein
VRQATLLRRIGRIVAAHGRTAGAVAAGLAAYVACLPFLHEPARAILAWDVFGVAFLTLITIMMVRSGPTDMPANARAQEDGEWSIFTITLCGTMVSFAAIIGEFSSTKDLQPVPRREHVALVIATLALSWLVTQVVFALRYAHEYYQATDGIQPDKGLDFPGDDSPDYWDFIYFAFVLGMTFQVSDVQITSRKFRRLATVHGMLGFLFNTVIIALTVNLAANLL